jgi:hypothetical protein
MNQRERIAKAMYEAPDPDESESSTPWPPSHPEDLAWWLSRADAALGVFEEAHTPTDDERTPEFEALEQELFKHQPVLSMTDGSIAGCQCMDRVFYKRTEDWGTHLAEVFEALVAYRTVQGEPSNVSEQGISDISPAQMSVQGDPPGAQCEGGQDD